MSAKYRKLEFTALEDELLIEKVKENPPLYAKRLKTYKDIQMKENIWKQIATDMGANKTGKLNKHVSIIYL